MPKPYIHNIKKNASSKDLAIIILSAGLGTRASGESKPLLKVNNEPIICRQIRILRDKYGENAEIISVLGYKSPEIITQIKHKSKIVINERFETTNVVYSLYLGLLATNRKSIIIVYGDIVFDFDALPEISNESFLLTSQTHMRNDEVGVLIHEKNIVNMIYDSNYKWCHIAYMCGKPLEELFDYTKSASRQKHFGYEAINHCLQKVGPLNYVNCNGKLIEVDTLKDLEIANTMFANSRRIN